MRKFLVILCSMALVAGTVAPVAPVVAATSSSVYDEDGDIIDNPWSDIFETEAPTEEETTTEAPTEEETTTEAPTEEETTTEEPTEEETTTEAVEFAIVTQPSDYEAEPGEAVVFEVGATGTGLTYQWQYSKDGATWKSLSGTAAKKATIKIAVQKNYNGFQYRCIVKDATGDTLVSDGGTITLVARTELAILEQPQDVIITGTQTATFHVEAQGAGLSYQWQYFVPSTGEWKKLSGTASRSATFSMEVNTSYFDGCKYRCFIKDCVGNTTVTEIAYIYVKKDFEIVKNPKDIGAIANDSITFEVDATGTGLTYQWQYCTKTGSTWKDLSGSVARTSAYTLTALSSFNGYKYRCVVTDYYGETKTTEYGTIVICDGITVNSQPQDVTVAAGDTAEFTVDAVGPGLTYQWQYCTKTGSTWKNLSAASATTDTFSISAIASFNGYKYRCVLTDSLGNVVETDYATLTVQ